MFPFCLVIGIFYMFFSKHLFPKKSGKLPKEPNARPYPSSKSSVALCGSHSRSRGLPLTRQSRVTQTEAARSFESTRGVAAALSPN